MHIVDVIGMSVVGAYLLIVAASDKRVRGVAKVSAKTVASSFSLIEKAYSNYLETNDEETEEVLRAIKKKTKHTKMMVEIDEPKEYEFML